VKLAIFDDIGVVKNIVNITFLFVGLTPKRVILSGQLNKYLNVMDHTFKVFFKILVG
jgi:hypothetical protein